MECANAAKDAVSDLNRYVDGAFADGLVSEAEAKAIEKYINTVNASKREADATYTALYANPFLAGTEKSVLYAAKNSLNTATTNLIAAINSAIADGKATTTEKNNVDSKFAAFNNAYASLATAIENANKAIQRKIKQEAIDESKSDLSQQIGEVSLKDRNDIAKMMGYKDYEEPVDYAERGLSVIKGGSVNTSLINADLDNHLRAHRQGDPDEHAERERPVQDPHGRVGGNGRGLSLVGAEHGAHPVERVRTDHP